VNSTTVAAAITTKPGRAPSRTAAISAPTALPESRCASRIPVSAAVGCTVSSTLVTSQ
jgi:hypothetical protein